MFSDPSFWFLVAFVIFVALIGKKLWVFITEHLDLRSEKIEENIEEAIRLRDDAQTLLNEAKQKHLEASQHADKIIDRANQEAVRISNESQTELEQFMKKRESQIEDRINYAEEQAVNDIRNQAIEIALSAAENLLKTLVDEKTDNKLIDKSLKELERSGVPK